MSNDVNLIEYIHPKMDILFVALNAPEKSNSNRHWFSGNLSFWNLMYNAGLITRPIFNELEGDIMVFKNSTINYKGWIYGITDLNRDQVQTDSSGVKTNTKQVERIIDILKKYEVGKLCLMHGKVAGQFEKVGLINRKSGGLFGYGIVGNYMKIPIYEVPFHNASIPHKHKYYELLKG